ncbi:cyclin kinase regulator CYCU4 [Acrasis kona]|uniref:Cyclin kinase regulator CYCU4 n=1 Tax=Acrasis kona TaxID=1008807 RepID=A0AAW2ZFK1_9EUKA
MEEPRPVARSNARYSAPSGREKLPFDSTGYVSQQLRLSQKADDKNVEEIFGVGPEDFISVFADLLEAIVENGDLTQRQDMTVFHNAVPPAISIHNYLQRILKFTLCSSVCYLISMVYLDRIVKLNPSFTISSKSIHRLILTSVMTAAKFFDEKFINNAYFAKVGGVTIAEMNNLEKEFLNMIGFSLHVSPSVFAQYRKELFFDAQMDQQLMHMSMEEIEHH